MPTKAKRKVTFSVMLLNYIKQLASQRRIVHKKCWLIITTEVFMQFPGIIQTLTIINCHTVMSLNNQGINMSQNDEIN